jgi:hypothetical protein
LIETLQKRALEEQSPFRRQLLREDVARLKKLRELAQACADLTAFKNAGMRIGWTQGDARTVELREPLERLLGAIHEYETDVPGARLEDAIEEAWVEFHRFRMERLLGCLATPAPRPVDY